MEIFSAVKRPPPVRIEVFSPSMTRQSEKDSCDINVIMRKYQKTGVLPVKDREAFFADVSQMGDYQEAIERVRMADEAFMAMPAKLRKKFENDPAVFLDFCSNPDNRDELVELGLIEKEKPAEEVRPLAGEAEPAGDPPGEGGSQ